MTPAEREEILSRHVDALASGIGDGFFTFTDPATGKWVQVAVAREGAGGEIYVNLGNQSLPPEAIGKAEALMGAETEDGKEVLSTVNLTGATTVVAKLFREVLGSADDFSIEVSPSLVELKRASNPLTTMLILFFLILALILVWVLAR